MTDRHPVTALLAHFDFGHLPEPLQAISCFCHDVAHEMVRRIPDDPELIAGLRHLLEAKDCFVRASRVAIDRNEANQ
jgi:hypothetical protein